MCGLGLLGEFDINTLLDLFATNVAAVRGLFIALLAGWFVAPDIADRTKFDRGFWLVCMATLIR